MPLTKYHAKRDFKRTPEPRGRTRRTYAAPDEPQQRGYLIQKHAASHLHYDFRLELDGVLLSWAVPKGPSLDPADKRLAVHVEDHPLEYGGFEGIIPKGQYGGGTVMLWDRGKWQPVGDPQQGLQQGHLKFDLQGEKLHGRWALVKTHGSKYGGKAEAWLLIKDKDDFARRGAAARVVDAAPDSVLSQRSIDEIAAAADHQWRSDRSAADNVGAGTLPVQAERAARGAKSSRKAKAASSRTQKRANATAAADLAVTALEGARAAALPKTLSPMLAALVKTVPQGDDWLHEIKYDGYRMVARVDRGQVRLLSRNGNEWSGKFTGIAAELKRLKADRAWLDGEVCAVDAQGVSHFQALQNVLSGEGKAKLLYFAFDLLYLDGNDLTAVALVERKRLLRDLLERSDTAVRYSPEVHGSGTAVFHQSCSASLEGIVSKRTDSLYHAGMRSREWVKVKCQHRQEMVIGGYTDPQGARSGFGALLLGYYRDGVLQYSGKVGTGFDEVALTALHRRLRRLEVEAPPFVYPPRGFAARGTHWVTPRLVAEIEFTEWSTSGALRHPAFIGLREDKRASEVVREQALPLVAAGANDRESDGKSGKAANSGKAGKAVRVKVHAAPKRVVTPAGKGDTANSVAGVPLSHPDKLLFPEAKLSKRALAQYYETVAEWILPQVRNRPLSLLRCPDGWGKVCFFQKHADSSVHPAVKRVTVPDSGGSATYFAVDTLQALVGLLQWGVIELHPWGSQALHPEKPDRLIFDLDPADDVTWRQLVEGVQALRTLLTQLGLTGFLKTTGGKGLHVVVPVRPTLTWTQAKNFTRAVAELFARTFPDRFIATASKAQRKGKIFIDYLRNAEGATAIAPYGIRARKNAPVSTPLAWEELHADRKGDVRFDHFNVVTLPARLARLRADPWREFAAVRQTVTAAMFKQVGASR